MRPGRSRALPADVRLVCFDRSTALRLLCHELVANECEHSPRRLVSDSQLSLKPLGRNATTSACHKEHGIEPKMKRCGRLVKDRPRCRVHMKSTGRAGPVLALLLCRVATEQANFSAPLAMRVVVSEVVAGVHSHVRQVSSSGKSPHELDQRVGGLRGRRTLRGFAVSGAISRVTRWTYTVKG